MRNRMKINYTQTLSSEKIGKKKRKKNSCKWINYVACIASGGISKETCNAVFI